jgi:predicted transcriptional regulator
MTPTGSEIVNLRLSVSLIDELDSAAEAENTTRKVIITRALAAAGYRVPQHDLEDRTPKRRPRRRA